MLDSYLVIGLVMVLVGFVKSFNLFTSTRGKLLVPLLVFAIAGLLNVANAIVFGGTILQALKDGFALGAAAGGIYSMGKAAMNIKYETVEPLPTDPVVKANSVEAKETEQNNNSI